jgi:O-antigen/teichoic acid export membrane protein
MSIEVGRNGVYIYIANMLNMILGYLFWILIAKFMGIDSASSIGTVSGAISFSTLLVSITLFGIPTGIQRFIGKSYVDRDMKSISSLIASSLILIVSISLLASIGIIAFEGRIISITKLSPELLVGSIILFDSTAVYQLIYSCLIATSQSKFLFFGVAGQAVSKILIMIILLTGGYGVNGLLLSFVISTLISLPVMFFGLYKKVPIIVRNIAFKKDIKSIVKASTVNWIPSMVSAIGGQLSVLVILGYSGASQAGEYYVASIVFSAVIAIPVSLASAAFPALSGMIDQSRILTSKIIKIGLMFSAPLSVIAAIYSVSILQLFSPHLKNAAVPQMLFMIAVVPTVLNYGVYYMLYAHGRYRSVLIIGLVENLSKVVLYFVLVPHYGSIGAVISFISGPILSMVVMSIIQRKYRTISWKRVSIIVAIPLAIGVCIYFLHLHYTIGIPVVLATSFYLYLKLTILDSAELREIIFAILPQTMARRIYPKMEYVVKVIGQKRTVFYD